MKYWFIAFSFVMTTAQALVLEDLAKINKLSETLAHKKVGLYVGPFNPLHKGHEETAKLPIQQGLCDYVLIYSAWGGDHYKNMVAIKYRLEMIFSALKTILMSLSPSFHQQS